MQISDEVDEVPDLETLTKDFLALPRKILLDAAQEIGGLVDGPNNIFIYCVVFWDDKSLGRELLIREVPVKHRIPSRNFNLVWPARRVHKRVLELPAIIAERRDKVCRPLVSLASQFALLHVEFRDGGHCHVSQGMPGLRLGDQNAS